MRFMGKVSFFLVIIATAVVYPSGAQAQQVAIATSADNFDNKFFGEGVLQVIINDLGSDDDSTVEDITVEIDAEPDTGAGGSGSFAIPETSEGSGRFEFYLVHVDANDVTPDEIDPINTAGVEGSTGAGANAAPIITFGPGADLAVAGAEDLYEEVSFEITTDDSTIIVDYEESVPNLSLDRASYGSDSFVYIFIHDNDANKNPTATVDFSLDPCASPNSDLFAVNGGTITQTVVFEETGDNTGVFKGRYQLGTSIVANSKSLVLLLNDKANYGATLSAAENDSNYTIEVSFTIGDTSGSLGVNEGQTPAQTYNPVLSANKDIYKIGESVLVSITDPDANANPDAADSIKVSVRTLSSGQEKEMHTIETGINTGVFALSFSLVENVASALDVIEVQDSDSVTIEYIDLRPANNAPAMEFSLQIQVAANAASSSEVVTPSRPLLEDVTGKQLPSLPAGQQAILSTMIKNNNDQPQPFVALLEVRDSDGVTVFLAWQTGTLNPSGQTDIGLSWQPEQAGSYSVRTFVISNLASPQVLSPVSESFVTVS